MTVIHWTTLVKLIWTHNVEETSTASYNNISISLPPAAFAQLNDTDVGVLFSFYNTSALFPVKRDSDSDFPEVVSPVIGASLAGSDSLVNLSQNIVMTLPFTTVSIIRIEPSSPSLVCIILLSINVHPQNASINTVVVCASWNFSAAGTVNTFYIPSLYIGMGYGISPSICAPSLPRQFLH